ncbi:MAG: hypothetical protein IT158_19000 [Bryobacterales bacterium]|nr:hypothetical protein [Bryobacterales bacterium]
MGCFYRLETGARKDPGEFGAGGGEDVFGLLAREFAAGAEGFGEAVERRADEALGYDAPADNATELGNIAVDAITGGVLAYPGGKIADALFPIPNVQREIALLRFAHRRSTRPARIQAAQLNAERQALFNSGVAGVAGGVPTESTKWIWQWFTSQTATQQQPAKKKKEVVTSRICYEDGTCTQ